MKKIKDCGRWLAKAIWYLFWLYVSVLLIIGIVSAANHLGLISDSIVAPWGVTALLATMLGSLMFTRAGAAVPVGCEIYTQIIAPRMSALSHWMLSNEERLSHAPRMLLSGALLFSAFILIFIWTTGLMAIPVVFMSGWIISSWVNGVKVGTLQFLPDTREWLHKVTKQTETQKETA